MSQGGTTANQTKRPKATPKAATRRWTRSTEHLFTEELVVADPKDEQFVPLGLVKSNSKQDEEKEISTWFAKNVLVAARYLNES